MKMNVYKNRKAAACLAAVVLGLAGSGSISAGEQEPAVSRSIVGVRIEEPDGEVFEAVFDPRSYKANYDYWSLLEPYKGVVSANTENLFELLYTAGYLYQIASGAPQSREERRETEDSVRIRVDFHEPGTDWQEYMNLSWNEDGMIYTVQADGYEPVETYYSAAGKLLDPDAFSCMLHLPLVVDHSTVSRALLSGEGGEHVLARTEDGWSWDGNGLTDQEFSEKFQVLLEVFLEGELDKEEAERIRLEEQPLVSLCFERTDPSWPVRTAEYYELDAGRIAVCVDGQVWFYAAADELDGMRELCRS